MTELLLICFVGKDEENSESIYNVKLGNKPLVLINVGQDKVSVTPYPKDGLWAEESTYTYPLEVPTETIKAKDIKDTVVLAGSQEIRLDREVFHPVGDGTVLTLREHLFDHGLSKVGLGDGHILYDLFPDDILTVRKNV